MPRHLRWSVIPAVLLALLVACEPASESAPRQPTAPSLSYHSGDHYLIEGRLPVDLPELQLSRLIDSSGGSIHLAGHSIEIPSGAVEAPTLFTLTLFREGYVEVELTAVVSTLLGDVLDVGGNGFGKDVALTLSYAAASNVGDPDDLVILRMLNDGGVEPLEVVLDREKHTVTAQLDHFSRYCLASN